MRTIKISKTQLHETALLRVLQDRRLQAERRSYYRQPAQEAA